jgi:hypothetical protein
MRSAPSADDVWKLSVYDGPACFINSIHNDLNNIFRTNISNNNADLFCQVRCVLSSSICHVIS